MDYNLIKLVIVFAIIVAIIWAKNHYTGYSLP